VKDERVYLGHIRDAINDIKIYASVGEEAFIADRMRQDAIIRKLEIIGEAVKQLSHGTRARRPEIPWKQIAGMRDRLTHAYFGVDLGLVWRVVERDLQPLEAAVKILLASDDLGSTPGGTRNGER
jgi:uncharacterized protein with HEPN domain